MVGHLWPKYRFSGKYSSYGKSNIVIKITTLQQTVNDYQAITFYKDMIKIRLKLNDRIW